MGSAGYGQEVLSHLLACMVKSLVAISGGSALIYIGYLRVERLDPVTLALYAVVGMGAVLYGIRASLGIVSQGGEGEKGRDLMPEEGPSLEVDEEIVRRPASRRTAERPKPRPDKCPECGAPVTSGGKFCGKCGTIFGGY